MTGRMMNEFWGKVHFWGSLIFMNVIFMPMFVQGMAGMLRRMSDGGVSYSMAKSGVAGALSPTMMGLNRVILWGAVGLGPVADSVHHQFVLQHQERRKGAQRQSVGRHHAGMADPHTAAARYNFRKDPVVYRGPYEYSVPGQRDGFHPANEARTNL